MKTMSAKDAKNSFGHLIDTARAEPVLIEKHRRGVVVVVAVEEYERMSHGSPEKAVAPIQPSRTQKTEPKD